MHVSSPKFIVALLVCAFSVMATALAETKMGASISPSTCAVGEEAFILLRVSGNPIQPDPQIQIEEGPEAGIEAERVSVGREIVISGGRRVTSFTYQFAVKGNKVGDYTLTASIEEDGKEITAAPIKFKVRPQTKAEESLEPNAELVIGKGEIYNGELVPVTFRIDAHPRTRLNVPHSTPAVESDGFVMRPLTGPFEAGDNTDGRRLVEFNGFCEALRPGELTVGPATYSLELSVPIGNFGQARRKRIDLTTGMKTIKVKPLPTEGKPDNFSGSVGEFQIAIDAGPLKLKQGDPISVNLTISGRGNFPSIEAPGLVDADGWKLYDAKRIEANGNQPRNDPRRRSTDTGRLIFNRMIVPEIVTSEIPPFEFSYFDPELGEYRTLRTDPIPIEVTEDPNAAAVAEAAAQPPAVATEEGVPNKPPPVEDMQDILTIRAGTDQPWRGNPKPLARSVAFWALQTPPAAALLGLVLFAAARRSKERKEANAWSGTYPPCQIILRKLQGGKQNAGEFYSEAHEFILAWEEQSPTAATANLAPELGDQIEKIRERHSFLEFGSANGESEQTVPGDERTAVINTLKSLPTHV